MRAVRFDAFPEEAEYRDEGCDVSPTCLNCPLEVCVFETEPRHVRRAREMAESAKRLREIGAPADVIAVSLGVSKRTIWRWLA